MRLIKKWGLVLILGIYLIKGIALILLIPPWEAPDEPGHVAYVLYMLTQNKLPRSDKPFIPRGIGESMSLSRTLQRKIQNNHKLPQGLALFNPYQSGYASRSANVASHPPIYYIYLISPFLFFRPNSGYLSLLVMRMGTLILGLITLACVYKLVKDIFQNNVAIPAFVCLLLAMHPAYSFIGAIVNSDMAVVLSFVLFLMLFNKLVLTKHKDKNIYKSLIIITALAPLVKPQLMLLPIFFICYSIYSRLLVSRAKLLITSLLVMVPSLLWLLYTYTQLGLDATTYPLQNVAIKHASVFGYFTNFIYGKQLVGIGMGLWGFFGWLNVLMPKWNYFLFAIVVFGQLTGWIFSLRDARSNTISWIKRKRWLLLVSMLYIGVIFVYDVYYYHFTSSFAIQGRYLLPILPVLLIFCVKGLDGYSIRIKKSVIGLSMVFFLISQFIMFKTIISYYYGGHLQPAIFYMYSL